MGRKAFYFALTFLLVVFLLVSCSDKTDEELVDLKINISFDLVMPDEEKCSFDKEKFENNLLSSLKEDVKLYIEYDESFADSLLVSDVTSSKR